MYIRHSQSKYESTLEIITRFDAAHKGLKRFYTGKPCVHGHDCERYVSTQGCVQCLRTPAAGLSKVILWVHPSDEESLKVYATALMLDREARENTPEAKDEKAYWRMIANFRKAGCPEAQIATMRTFGTFTLPADKVP